MGGAGQTEDGDIADKTHICPACRVRWPCAEPERCESPDGSEMLCDSDTLDADRESGWTVPTSWAWIAGVLIIIAVVVVGAMVLGVFNIVRRLPALGDLLP